MAEIIYVFTNPYMPDVVKIGRTSNLEKRRKALSAHAGVPISFECYYACEVEDGEAVEKRVHDALDQYRENRNREFFKISPARAEKFLRIGNFKEVTPTGTPSGDAEEMVAREKIASRRSAFRFSMVDISRGAELKFAKNPEITCDVVSDTKVRFDGRELPLSTVTLEILTNRLGYRWLSARGSDHWMFEDEVLTDRRLRMEESED